VPKHRVDVLSGGNDTVQNPTQTQEKVGAGNTTNQAEHAGQTKASYQPIPEDLRPIVQQQLEAAATQRVFWHGEIWPQQTIDWEVEWQQSGGEGNPDEDEGGNWRTIMSLTTPYLGKIDATLSLTAQGVRISLTAKEDSSVSELQVAAPALADALSSAGVPLLAFQVRHDDEYPAG
jgi:hypothetical protein